MSALAIAPVADPYADLLQAKIRFSRFDGFPLDPSGVHALLKPHQADIVRWAVAKGRAAIFAAFGLGKTFMQLEILRAIGAREGGCQLQVIPLGTRADFRRDMGLLGIDGRFIRSTAEIDGPGLYLTNPESVVAGKIDTALFNAVSLDEAAILRDYGSDTYQSFVPLFADVRYRFVATATPSPNRYKELIHYAAFLGVMDTGAALTRFFQRNSEKAGDLTIHPHMEDEFHLWLHSWAVFIQRPSDLGYSDDGYALPPVEIVWHEVPAPSLLGKVETNGQGRLLADAALGLKDAADAKRASIPVRVDRMVQIVRAEPGEHFLLWHHLEAERVAIKAALPAAVEVYGALDLDERERRIVDFADGRTQYLATKPEISGAGCNFQRHCARAVFVGIDYRFHDLIQAVHRIVRFLQPRQCVVHFIYTETEREIRKELERKWTEHERLGARMSDLLRRYGLSTEGFEAELGRRIGLPRHQVAGDRFLIAHNDCVAETRGMEANSVDMVLTSIPFGNHYEYSDRYEDFGHNPDFPAFFRQMDHLTPELRRVLRPGRMAAIHVKDRILFGNVTGWGNPTVEPFHADCIAHYRRHGLLYCGMITVVTDVVRENNQTYRLSYGEMLKDGTKMGVGSPEYVLLFRKPQSDLSKGYADVPVVKSADDYSLARWQVDAHAFWRSSGNRLLTAAEFEAFDAKHLPKAFADISAERVYDFEEHVAAGDRRGTRLPRTFMGIAPGSPDPDVWTDVVRMRTLNTDQAAAAREKHICPFQIDVVERLIERFTNRDELVFDPFGGLMTVPWCAIRRGRRGRASELNEDYFRDGLRFLRAAEREIGVPTLFDMLAAPAANLAPDDGAFPPTAAESSGSAAIFPGDRT